MIADENALLGITNMNLLLISVAAIVLICGLLMWFIETYKKPRHVLSAGCLGVAIGLFLGVFL